MDVDFHPHTFFHCAFSLRLYSIEKKDFFIVNKTKTFLTVSSSNTQFKSRTEKHKAEREKTIN